MRREGPGTTPTAATSRPPRPTGATARPQGPAAPTTATARPADFGSVRPGWLRHRGLARGGVLLLAATAPFFDVLRLDLPSRSAVLLGRHLWLNDLYLLLLLLLGTMFAFAAVSVVLGRVFCGWLCPQTTVTAVALATVRLLSPRRPPLPEPRSPAELAGWRRFLFHAAAAAASLVGAFALSAYFVSPARLVGNLVSLPALPERPVLLLFLGLAAGLFLDAAVLRQRLCLVCPLGAAMSLLRGESALQVGVPRDRLAEACGRCTACRRLCPFGLDPRRPDPRLCTNCGECLVACAAVSAVRGRERPLRFGFGAPGAAEAKALETSLPGRSLALGRTVLAGALAAALLAAFALGLIRRPPVGLAVERVPGRPAAFHILVRNQMSRPLTVELAVAPPAGWQATLTARRLPLAPARPARVSLALLPPPDATAGPYPFQVVARPHPGPGRTMRLRSAVFLP